MREAKSKEMMKSLVPVFSGGDRLDLFRAWLEKGGDWAKTAVEIERKNIQKQSANSKDKCMSRRDLEESRRYSPEDIRELIERKTRLGQFISDPNFPEREDLRQYLVNTEVSSEISNIRQNSQSLASNTALSSTEALALTEDGADFGSGGVPTVADVVGYTGSMMGGNGDGQGDQKGGKGGRKNKNTGKGGAGGKSGKGGRGKGEGEDAEVKPLSPLEKANLLKKAVSLGIYLTTNHNKQ